MVSRPYKTKLPAWAVSLPQDFNSSWQGVTLERLLQVGCGVWCKQPLFSQRSRARSTFDRQKVSKDRVEQYHPAKFHSKKET